MSVAVSQTDSRRLVKTGTPGIYKRGGSYVVVGRDLRIIDATGPVERMLGRGPGDLAGSTLADLVFPQEWPGVEALLAEAVDLPGTTILPGFVDAHVHLTGTGLSASGPDLSAVRSAEGLVEAPFSTYPNEVRNLFAAMEANVGRSWPDPAGLGPPVSDQMTPDLITAARKALREADRRSA